MFIFFTYTLLSLKNDAKILSCVLFETVSRTAEEEEGFRASEAIDRILSRLSKSDVVVKGKPIIN